MNGTKFILDTNTVFFLLQGKLLKLKELKQLSELAISIITELEFYSNKELSANDILLFDSFKKSIQTFYITQDDRMLIQQVVSIRKKYKLKLPDAIIAATALVNNATLISADKEFSKIFNLKFQLIKL